MYSFQNKSHEAQAGFTLVELAVVMIIIGLLIGGVLKGQELINNAQVTATVSQVRGFDAATTTFRDMYSSFPGDMINSGTRIPNCTAVGGCNVDGDADGRLETAPSVAPGAEESRFFVQLSAADLVGGINAPLGAVWGGIFPGAELGGSGFHPSFFNGGVLGQNAAGRSGHYLTLTRDANAAPAPGITTSEASRLDSKLDDGSANSGSVFVEEAGCHAGTGVYSTATQGDICTLYIRFQN